jgi:predicted CxxxxCH...CXXCH cytochrome family protein
MIGGIDSYTPGATPGTGSCNLYCHSDGTEDPLDVPGTYFYFLGAPPLWNQTTGIISCGNAVIGTTAAPIYQCHGYPPPTHPGGAGGGGGGIQNCAMCHPTPLLGVAPDNTVHINGFLDVTGGGFGGGGGPGGGGVGGGIPVI